MSRTATYPVCRLFPKRAPAWLGFEYQRGAELAGTRDQAPTNPMQAPGDFSATSSASSLSRSVSKLPSASQERLCCCICGRTLHRRSLDPSCKERITSHGDFHPHVRCRQASLFERPEEHEFHVCVCSGALEGLANERSARRPQRELGGKHKQRGPRRLVKSEHA